MSPSAADLRATVVALLPEAERFLADLIRFPSLPGHERGVMDYVHAMLRQLPMEIQKVHLPEEIVQDPDFSNPIPGIVYGDGRYNIVAVRKGSGGGKRILINTHLDVVPVSEGMEDAWNPRVVDGRMYGRGSCDAKGQAAALYLLLKTLDRLGIRTPGDLVLHFVVEEEVGGNGTLAVARTRPSADACIVMEPTEGRICAAVRGAVWFRLTLRGHAGHSGQSSGVRSALTLAREAMDILEQYHARLLTSSRGLPLFDRFPNPMPLTFGTLNAGRWPASVPDGAVIEGVLGFLPNKTKEAIGDEFRQALEEGKGGMLKDCFDLIFTYRHDASVVDGAHEFPAALLDAARSARIPAEITAMTASCDAWYYRNWLKIPTVVFGVGSLGVAHAKDEHVALDEIARMAEALAIFLLKA